MRYLLIKPIPSTTCSNLSEGEVIQQMQRDQTPRVWPADERIPKGWELIELGLDALGQTAKEIASREASELLVRAAYREIARKPSSSSEWCNEKIGIACRCGDRHPIRCHLETGHPGKHRFEW